MAFGQTLSGVLKIEDYAASLESPFLNVDAVANILYNSLGYIILFFAVLLAAWLISIILGAVGKAPVLGAMDRVGGLVVGLLGVASSSWWRCGFSTSCPYPGRKLQCNPPRLPRLS